MTENINKKLNEDAADKYTLFFCTETNLVFPISIVSFGDYVEELGHPYIWVQTLGGLHFPNDSSEVRLLSPDRIAPLFVP